MTLPAEPSGSGPFSAPGAGQGWGGPAPTTVAPGARPKRPSPLGYWLGALILAGGGIAAMIWMTTTIFGVFGAVENYPRVPVPGEATISLDPGTYKVFAEYPGATTDFGIPLGVGAVDVTGPRGEVVAVESPQMHETYSWNGREGRAVAEFTAATGGDYDVKVSTSSTGTSRFTQATVGKGIDASVAGKIVGAIAAGAVAALIGVVLIVVTVVRRSRWKRAYASPPGYPSSYSTPGPGGPYGAGGYGQPGFGPPPAYGHPGPSQPPAGQPPAGQPPGPAWPPPEAPVPPPVTHPPGWGSAPGVPRPPAPGDPPRDGPDLP